MSGLCPIPLNYSQPKTVKRYLTGLCRREGVREAVPYRTEYAAARALRRAFTLVRQGTDDLSVTTGRDTQ